ncbi:MAG: hypothetical protein KAQ65_05500 [Candidatus Thorarchaeota archaeon]|nr:hypothetical protein [Candidatus Thorarchaeota archaeon]
MEKQSHSNGILLKFGCPLVLILILGFSLGILIIPVIEDTQFSEVISFVNNDMRCPTPITYACPNCTSETGWSFGDYVWERDGFIDWNQIELFLSSLEYHNKTVYRCDYYRTHHDDPPWRLFLWFQTGEYDYVFLRAS